ncbi:UNVERIFIED_ORG: integrase [Rhizobium esperanzae]
MSKQTEPKKKITRAVLENAQPHEDGKTTRIIWDCRLTGFGLRIRPSGAKAFVYVYRANGRPKWATIKATSADDAFDQATEMANQYYRGKDPVAEREEAQREAQRKSRGFTVGDVLDTFITEHAKRELKEKTWSEYDRIVTKVLKPEIGKIKIDDLSTEDVSALYEKLKTRPRKRRGKASPNARPLPPATTQAAGVVRVLSSAMRWASYEGKLRRNPIPINFAGLRLKGTRRRERLFSENEVARLQAATDKLKAENRLMPSVALAIGLLFATGCRAAEIAGLRWDWIDNEHGLIIWPKTKTGRMEKAITPEIQALLDGAQRVVGSPWVCPATDAELPLRVDVLRSGFKRVMKEAGVAANENAALHLIRHWFSTKTYTDKTIPLPLQMAIVGHANVATAMRYSHVSRDELTAASRDLAERRLAKVQAAAKNGVVVPIRGDKE